MSEVTYECGGGWRAELAGLIPAGRGRPALPWDDEYAERVFLGEFPPAKSSVPGLPSIEGFVVLQRCDGAPTAIAEFQNAGHTVLVDFLNSELSCVLSFLFVDASRPPHYREAGVVRPGELFFTNIMSFAYSGEQNRYGNPIKSRQLQSGVSTDSTQQGVMVEIEDSERPYTGPAVVDVDVSGDGYWEPVATFGDWERWFVRDRPGVELFD